MTEKGVTRARLGLNWTANQIQRDDLTWRGQLREGQQAFFFGAEGHSEPTEPAIDVKTLHARSVS